MTETKENESKEKINVRSLDFDDCIFNSAYRKSKSKNRLIETNKSLIEGVSEQIKAENFSKVIIMLGSNRQSFYDDWHHEDGEGSCFPALFELYKAFQNYIDPSKVELDPLLLADIYGRKQAGDNFDHAIQHHNAVRNKQEHEPYDFSFSFMDSKKLNLLYAQMHKIASQHPDAEIIYDFYDDDAFEENTVLHDLKKYFEENPDLIPNNLRLYLHHYAGEEIREVANIKGTGKIDYNYEYNIKKMLVDTHLCDDTIFSEPCGDKPSSSIIKFLTGDILKHFKETRDTGTQPLVRSVTNLKETCDTETRPLVRPVTDSKETRDTETRLLVRSVTHLFTDKQETWISTQKSAQSSEGVSP
jgi:hypothetical protein